MRNNIAFDVLRASFLGGYICMSCFQPTQKGGSKIKKKKKVKYKIRLLSPFNLKLNLKFGPSKNGLVPRTPVFRLLENDIF